MSDEREELAKIIFPVASSSGRLYLADKIIAAGYHRQPVVETEPEWETPHCHLDEWGKLEHSVNCECYGDLVGPKRRRRKAGPWVPVEDGS